MSLSYSAVTHLAEILSTISPIFLQTTQSSFSVWEQIYRLLLLEDYNTRIVLLGTAILGGASGVVGVFTLLRKRALMGDAISHATLPGIAISFLLATTWGWNEKSLFILLTGATITGLLGVGAILAIRNLTKLKEDAALGIVLSVFFGAGISLLGLIQQMPRGHAAGLESFILGKTASMVASDAQLIALASFLCLAFCIFFFKELKLLCFDEVFAGSRGYPIFMLDLLLMTSVVIISIVGLQAVGLIMVVALLVIPAAAARFWTDNLVRMTIISAGIGTLSGISGAAISAIYPKLPSGSMIVLFCASCFAISMTLGTRRGMLIRILRRFHIRQSVERQHFLRSMFELSEHGEYNEKNHSIAFNQLLPVRSWSRRELKRAINRAIKEEWVTRIGSEIKLTKKGNIEAERLTREHRLWELFLIHHADFSLNQVDREADHIEHVLEPEIVAELESILSEDRLSIPKSPHRLNHQNQAKVISNRRDGQQSSNDRKERQ